MKQLKTISCSVSDVVKDYLYNSVNNLHLTVRHYLCHGVYGAIVTRVSSFLKICTSWDIQSCLRKVSSILSGSTNLCFNCTSSAYERSIKSRDLHRKVTNFVSPLIKQDHSIPVMDIARLFYSYQAFFRHGSPRSHINMVATNCRPEF